MTFFSSTAGEDYGALSEEVTFEMGELTSGPFTLVIQNDDINELPEAFTVVLSSPTIGLSLGEIFTGTVDITDDDGMHMCNISQVCCFLCIILVK